MKNFRSVTPEYPVLKVRWPPELFQQRKFSEKNNFVPTGLSGECIIWTPDYFLQRALLRATVENYVHRIIRWLSWQTTGEMLWRNSDKLNSPDYPVVAKISPEYFLQKVLKFEGSGELYSPDYPVLTVVHRSLSPDKCCRATASDSWLWVWTHRIIRWS
jgi:hypothetical protein